MNFKFCPECASKLIKREIADEGRIPFCEFCKRPWFPFSYPCVICLVVNDDNKIALIKQSYGSDRYVCVAGYIKCGETAEECAEREIKEEIGLDVIEARFIKSYSYEKRDNLMLGFVCKVKSSDFTLSGEVDKADWFTPKEADEKLKNSLIARQLLIDFLEQTDTGE